MCAGVWLVDMRPRGGKASVSCNSTGDGCSRRRGLRRRLNTSSGTILPHADARVHQRSARPSQRHPAPTAVLPVLALTCGPKQQRPQSTSGTSYLPHILAAKGAAAGADHEGGTLARPVRSSAHRAVRLEEQPYCPQISEIVPAFEQRNTEVRKCSDGTRCTARDDTSRHALPPLVN